MKTIRIFISSPSDVAIERDKARKVIASLQKRYAGRLYLETVLWEDLPLGAVNSFQGGIDVVLKGEKAIDIAVFILWSRLGSPLGTTIRKADQSEYRSGTEREFDLMLSARAASPDNRPEILMYVRQDYQAFTAAFTDKSMHEIDEMVRQYQLAEQFIQEQFQDAESGTNIRAYHTFPEPNSFAERLKAHLRNLLDAIALNSDLEIVSWEGSPYRGLEVFQAEHAPIFFGRDEEIGAALERLRVQAASGCAFLLLVGASGSGKSSLARAGILPALESDNPDETVAEWRTAVLTPGECAENLCHGLARILLDRLPELRGDEKSLDDLAQALHEGQGKALALLLRRACAGANNRGPIRLVLLIDQLEELFTYPSVTESAAAAFFTAVEVLARSGCIWVLATVRSDFYDRCQRFPKLMEMKGESGWMDLLPPEPSDIHRIITGPAVLSGVNFEKNASGESLDQRILNDTVGHPEALPLLEFALAQLYEARTAEGLLTFAAYEALGGIEGAIGRHAEAVFMAQPEAIRGAFGSVFHALVSIDEADDGRPVRRRVAMEALSGTPECRQLINVLLAARLLSSDRGEIFVAHEALLRRWNRAVQWIEANRARLRIRARVAARMAEGALLAENDPLTSLVRHHLAESPDTFDSAQCAYITAQLAQLDAAQRRRERIRRGVVAGLSVLTLFALIGGVVAAWQWRVADLAKSAAETAKNKAETEAQIAEQTTKFLTGMFESIDPATAKLREITVREILDEASKTINSAFPGQPRVEMQIRRTLGTIYGKLGRYDLALLHAEVALRRSYLFPHGDDDDVATSLNNVGFCLGSLGRSAEALPKHEAAFEMFQRIHKGDHPYVATSLNNVGGCLDSLGRSAEALPKYEAALEMRQRIYKGDHPDVALSLNNVGGCLDSLGRSAEALPKYEVALGMSERILSRNPSLQNVNQIRKICRIRLGLDRAEVFVAAVVPGSQAEKLGLREGDVLLRYDGKEIVRPDQLIALTTQTKGPKISLEIRREGKLVTFSVSEGRLGIRLEVRTVASDKKKKP